MMDQFQIKLDFVFSKGLDVLRTRFEAGDGEALFEAIDIHCVQRREYARACLEQLRELPDDVRMDIPVGVLRELVEQTAPPCWVVAAFASGWLKWLNQEAASLNGAFGIPLRKGLGPRAVANKRRRKAVQVEVVREVFRLRFEEGAPIDELLFDRVGEKLKISGQWANKLWYEFAKSIGLTVGRS
jgi:hypothetical protein